jgi:hypothetical protein
VVQTTEVAAVLFRSPKFDAAMITNTLSVTAYLVNGIEFPLLTQTPPEVALAEYFCPDVHPRVQYLVIEVTTHEGKRIKLQISPDSIQADTEEL